MTLPTIGQIAEFVYTVLLRPPPLRGMANRLILMLLPATCREGEAVVCLNPRDPVVSGGLAFGVYERSEVAFFRNSIQAGMQVMDIGANVGLFTALALAKVGPKGSVHAFEPDAESFHFLGKTVAANPQATARLHQLALSSVNGVQSLHISADNRGDNRLYAHDFSDTAIPIETRTLDSLLESGTVPSPDFIKMDVQGYEGHVMAGMSSLLSSGNPLTIMFEFWPQGLSQAGSNALELLDQLRAWRFQIEEITPEGTTKAIESFAELIAKLPGRKYTNLVAMR